jgi:alcohol dehydrogenase (cytochrome c)
VGHAGGGLRQRLQLHARSSGDQNLVLLGVSGGEYGIRGFIDAYEAATGQRKWRFYTIPAPGEPGSASWEGDSWKIGGSPAWITGTYDPETNTTFWTTGNPSPSNRGIGRAGDNLYSNSLLALDPDTGKLKWHFQFTRHDEHDYDATQIPVMVNDGDKKLILQANRNGFFYVIDRSNGKLLRADSYAKVSWSKEKDSSGLPIPSKEASPTPDGNRVCPGAAGATNWMSPTYDPQTKLFYVTAREQCDVFSTAPQPYEPGHAYYGSAYFPNEDAEPFYGALRALDPATGKMKWEWKHPSPTWSGVLSTAGGLVFTGDAEGNFIALDAATGKPSWHFQCGAPSYSAPMTYAINGKQYIAVAAGSTCFTFALTLICKRRFLAQAPRRQISPPDLGNAPARLHSDASLHCVRPFQLHGVRAQLFLSSTRKCHRSLHSRRHTSLGPESGQ